MLLILHALERMQHDIKRGRPFQDKKYSGWIRVKSKIDTVKRPLKNGQRS